MDERMGSAEQPEGVPRAGSTVLLSLPCSVRRYLRDFAQSYGDRAHGITGGFRSQPFRCSSADKADDTNRQLTLSIDVFSEG